MNNCKSFNFIIDENSEILILGSMPSVKSLSEKQYYAHPKNRFWKVMGLICNYDLYNSSYERKIEIILKNRFAIWDVIKTCKRKGSLDSNIQNEIPNEIDRLLKKYKNIKTIILNGNKAYQAFKKYFPALIKAFLFSFVLKVFFLLCLFSMGHYSGLPIFYLLNRQPGNCCLSIPSL